MTVPTYLLRVTEGENEHLKQWLAKQRQISRGGGGILPSGPTSLTPTSELAPNLKASSPVSPMPPSTSRKHRPKWHFGIRSRSPPMEVMVEIYRTLKTLGFEWKTKDLTLTEDMLPGAAGPSDPDELRRKQRKDDEDKIKKVQELFFIETRCRMDDVLVRFPSLHLLAPGHSKQPFRSTGTNGSSTVSDRQRELPSRLSKSRVPPDPKVLSEPFRIIRPTFSTLRSVVIGKRGPSNAGHERCGRDPSEDHAGRLSVLQNPRKSIQRRLQGCLESIPVPGMCLPTYCRARSRI